MPLPTMSAVKARVRPATLDDGAAMNAVQMRQGMPGFDIDAWTASIEFHPFKDAFRSVPIGWVLESDNDGVVGTLSNIHMPYELNGRPLKGALAGSWAVDHAYRDSSLLLSLQYLNQRNVDVCIIGTASSVTSQVMTRFRIPRVPLADFNVALFWVTAYSDFAVSVLRKKNVPFAGLLGPPAAVALRTADLLIRPRRRKAHLRRYDDFPPCFNRFWDVMRSRPGERLRAIRTSAVLTWRFRQHLLSGRIRIIGALDNHGDLSGYCILVRTARKHIGLEQYLVADIQSVAGPEVLSALLQGAIDQAREDGLHMLELRGGHPETRAAGAALRCHMHTDAVWPAYFKAFDAGVRETLSRQDTWDLLPFDSY